LGVAHFAERPHGQCRAFAQDTAHRDDAMQIEGRKFAADRRTPIIAVPRQDGSVADLRWNIVDAANTFHIGHRFNVEDEDRRHARLAAGSRMLRSTGEYAGRKIAVAAIADDEYDRRVFD